MTTAQKINHDQSAWVTLCLPFCILTDGYDTRSLWFTLRLMCVQLV